MPTPALISSFLAIITTLLLICSLLLIILADTPGICAALINDTTDANVVSLNVTTRLLITIECPGVTVGDVTVPVTVP